VYEQSLNPRHVLRQIEVQSLAATNAISTYKWTDVPVFTCATQPRA